jgi:hypothetical protein
LEYRISMIRARPILIKQILTKRMYSEDGAITFLN